MKRNKKKQNKKQNVYIFDLDDTLCDTDHAIISTAYALSFLGNEEMEAVEDRPYIHLSDSGLVAPEDEDRALRLMDVFGVWERLELFNGVSNVLREITSKGHYIVYITKRQKHLRDQTLKWLQTNNLPQPIQGNNPNIYDFDQRVVLMVEGENKHLALSRVVNYHKGKDIYYFENDPEYVKEGSALGIKKIFTFDYGYNRGIEFANKVELLDNPREGCFVDLHKELDL